MACILTNQQLILFGGIDNQIDAKFDHRRVTCLTFEFGLHTSWSEYHD